MIVYLLNVALVICTSLVFYKVLLRNETFFRLNRFMLLGCLILSFTLPLIHVPPQWSFRNAGSVINSTYLLPSAERPDNKLSAEKAATASIQLENPGMFRDLSVADLLVWVYWTGVAIFAVNFIVQLLTLLYRAYSRPVIQDGRFRIVELSGDQAPCSFGNNIFINPEKYEWETYSQIILHEKIHIQQGHSYDILLAELALIFQWFNPFAWLYRKAVEDNLEFLTDNDLLEHKDIDRSSYQLSLVKVSAPHFPVSLTTNYNQSILKKRLIMMNAKKSNLNTTWKYLFILPMLMVFICFFNEPQAYGTQRKNVKLNVLAALPALGEDGTWFATIKDNKVNIRFEKESDGKVYYSNSSDFMLSDFKNLPRDQEGNFELTREPGTIVFNGKFSGNRGMGTYKFNQDQTFMDFLKKEGIKVNEKQDPSVFFAVDLKKSYISMLKREGYTNFTADDLIPLAALKIDEKFIQTIKSNGFSEVSLQDLIPLKAVGVDEAYIAEIRKSGYKDLTVSQLITFKAQNISGDFIKSSKEAVQQASVKSAQVVLPPVSKASKTVSPRKQKQGDLPVDVPISMDNLIAMKALNISPDYLNSFKQIGYKVSGDEIIAMKSLGVTSEYVKSFQDAGFKNIDNGEIISMKALGVTAADIVGYKKLGYPAITIEEAISAKATGVTPAYISSMKKKGYNLPSIEKYVEAKAVSGSIN